MKKSYNSADLHQKQGQELSKKLYRTISDHTKRLDDARGCARNIGELFSPNLLVQRRKLCDYGERLIFAEPILYGRKIEELLWRKGFYDVVAAAKALKKKEFSPEESSHLLTHISAGIGFYHHFLSKLQKEFNLSLQNVVDFALITAPEHRKADDSTEDILKFANHAIHQCLIYLGDLSRYKLDLYPQWEPTPAVRYYLQAIAFNPDCGMPHNQMGTLARNQNRQLDAVYHYMRCLACSVSFEGTVNNLHSLFEMNSKFLERLPEEDENADCIIQPEKNDHIKRFVARFLLLVDIWYFNKKVHKVFNLCHQTFKDLEECLSFLKPTASESGDSPADSESVETDSSSSPSYLTSNTLFKIVVICLLCITKLQSVNSQHVSTVVAFTLAVYSQLIQNITNHIQESVQNYPLPEHKPSLTKQVKKSKLRRRKIVKVDSDESDISDNEGSNDEFESGSSSDDSFISDVEDILANSSDEEPDPEGNSEDKSDEAHKCKSNKESKSDDGKSKEDVINKVRRMDVNDMLEIIAEESSLQCVKVLSDWLIHDKEVLKSCGENTRSLFRQIALLLNLVNINLKKSKIAGGKLNVVDLLANESKIPLPEDITLRGLEILNKSQSNIEWSYFQSNTISSKEETILRIMKILSFGKALCEIDEVGINMEKKSFVCQSDDLVPEKLPDIIVEELELQDGENGMITNNNKQEKDPESRGLLKMKHMGQLWLAAEVRALESRVRGKASLSPYLVLDADALIQYTYMVKNLVHSRKFIVLVPSAVVSALDDLKREKPEARDAIRWLESQFHRGNRFFRAQRPQERASIPFIKYPKKKDKEMFIYIQIIECCYYLTEQQKDATNLVTLLVGNQNILTNGESKELSYVGLAQSAGVKIESITQFYGKWKKSSKGKR